MHDRRMARIRYPRVSGKVQFDKRTNNLFTITQPFYFGRIVRVRRAI